MIITRLRGGLGNQMFQYAYGKKAASERNTPLRLDHSWFYSSGAINPKREYDLGIFTMKPTRASKLELFLTKLIGQRIKENTQDATISSAKNIYLDGFWQSPKYLTGIEESLREDFRFASPILPASAELAHKITESESVCINVRRTDFISDQKFIGVSYYKQAAELIHARFPDAPFFVFSDDISWCKENLNFLPNATFVGYDHAGPAFGNYLQLMTLCRHFIIPNSTFAWWAAWLGAKPGTIVVAPKVWSQGVGPASEGIVPKNWTRL